MDNSAVVALRYARQGFAQPADGQEYDAVFQDLSPVQCEYWSRPGDPPRLFQRSLENDFSYNDDRRKQRQILKGRFQGGGIAYVTREDLELMGCLYRKTSPLPPEAFTILDLLEREGPLTANQLRDMTGLGKLVASALQKLQEAFLIFEDQVDCDWERAFYPFSSEFPEVNLERYTPQESLVALLPRFWHRMVLATEADAKSYYRRTGKEIAAAVSTLVADGTLTRVEGGYVCTADLPLLCAPADKPQGILPLHRNDPLVKAWEHTLKTAYPHDVHQVIYYLMVDGEIGGAVLGRYSNKVNELELVVFDNPAHQSRVGEVAMALTAVTKAPLRCL